MSISGRLKLQDLVFTTQIQENTQCNILTMYYRVVQLKHIILLTTVTQINIIIFLKENKTLSCKNSKWNSKLTCSLTMTFLKNAQMSSIRRTIQEAKGIKREEVDNRFYNGPEGTLHISKVCSVWSYWKELVPSPLSSLGRG